MLHLDTLSPFPSLHNHPCLGGEKSLFPSLVIPSSPESVASVNGSRVTDISVWVWCSSINEIAVVFPMAILKWHIQE